MYILIVLSGGRQFVRKYFIFPDILTRLILLICIAQTFSHFCNLLSESVLKFKGLHFFAQSKCNYTVAGSKQIFFFFFFFCVNTTLLFHHVDLLDVEVNSITLYM